MKPSFLILDNYKRITINVIIFFGLFSLLSSCEASIKAEKTRKENEFKTVSEIPPSNPQSEYLTQVFEKQQPPQYPWECK